MDFGAGVAGGGTGQLAAGGVASNSILPALGTLSEELICGSFDVDRSGAEMGVIEFRGGIGQYVPGTPAPFWSKRSPAVLCESRAAGTGVKPRVNHIPPRLNALLT